MRLLVAQIPMRRADGAPVVAPAACSATGETASICVKLTFDLLVAEGDVASLAPSVPQPGMSRGALLDLPGASQHELATPDDFGVAIEEGTRIFVVGHAKSAAAQQAIFVRVAAADSGGGGVWSRTASAVAAAPASTVPLTGAFLRAEDGAAPSESWAPTHASQGVAQPGLALVPGGWIETINLIRPGRVVFRLPEWRWCVEGKDARAELRVRTLQIDVDRPTLTLRLFASLPTEQIARGPSCALVRSGPDGDENALEVRAHGALHRTWLAEDVPGGPAPPDAAARLAARIDPSARPRPRLMLDEYVLLAASLAEAPAERERLLAGAGYTEDRWVVEEIAWLDTIASHAMDGDPSYALAYGEMMSAEQRRIGESEAIRPVQIYARARVAIEEGFDPADVLRELELGIPAFVRLEEHWQGRATTDERVRDEVDRAIEDERARVLRARSVGRRARGGS